MLRLPPLVLGLTIALLLAASGVVASSKRSYPSQASGSQIWLPLVVQQPPDVRVRNHTSRGLGSDRVVIVGEVVNDLSAPVYLVNVTARLYDAASQQVATTSILATLVQTAPGQRNPFRLEFDPAPVSATRYDLSLSWTLVNRSTYRPITILRPQIRNNNGVEVQGDARNDEQKSLRTGKVVATFYDADGTVVDTAASIIGKTFLNSGDRYPFTIRTGRAISFAIYTVQAEGYVKP